MYRDIISKFVGEDLEFKIIFQVFRVDLLRMYITGKKYKKKILNRKIIFVLTQSSWPVMRVTLASQLMCLLFVSHICVCCVYIL
jgi:hypothetical protein